MLPSDQEEDSDASWEHTVLTCCVVLDADQCFVDKNNYENYAFVYKIIAVVHVHVQSIPFLNNGHFEDQELCPLLSILY